MNKKELVSKLYELENKVKELSDKVEVLEFQRDVKNNIKLISQTHLWSTNEFYVKYVNAYNVLKTLRLPHAQSYHIADNKIVSYDLKKAFVVDIESDVLIELPKTKNNSKN